MPPILMYSVMAGTYKNIYLGHQKCTVKDIRDDEIILKILPEKEVIRETESI